MRMLDVLRGVWPVDSTRHTVPVTGMSVTGLCARFAPTIKWHRIALRGAHFGLHSLQNETKVFLKLV